ncbi:hypothetical protein MAP00_008173 [Monascus purpureus]|nr:hypothetical protein MAP00_008173 [Monascus purpureus]
MAPRGRGKFSKPSRGGGKHFSRDVQPVDKDGNPVGLWRDPEDGIPSSSDEDQNESGSEEESSEEEQAGPSQAAGEEMTREQRRAAAKARKQAAFAKKNQTAAQPGDLPPSESEESDLDLPANPNHTAGSRAQLQKGLLGEETSGRPKDGDTSQLSRREREAIEAQQARERYMKLHAEGKTEEARADLARLALVRERREAERARKEAEKEEKAEREKARAEAREREMQQHLAAKGKKGSSKNKH